ncbi:thioredoxin-like protein [Gorgonomyces haynaldii]|nr:thioredoxin-like protein [Gorgonomyces haynaldii]
MRIFNRLRVHPFVRLLSTETKTRIESTINGSSLVVFMKGTKEQPMCGFSRAVTQILQLQGVQDYKDVNVLEDEDIRQGIKEFSSWPTIPQVYVKGEFVGGCDIMISMHQSGELEELLTKHKLVASEQQ